MEPIDIKHAIEKAGYTQKEVAVMCGVTPTQVRRVIWGSKSLNVRSAISTVIKKPISKIWPENTLKMAS